jgi:methyl halide transferase
MTNVNTQQFWQSLYESDRTAWDLGGPTPVFRRLLQEGRLPHGRMIVLGAGRGHDAHFFARHGFDVTAVDFAPAAIRALHNANDGDAAIAIVQSDIFALNPILNGIFDYVLDYTFYCAIAPQRREEYAAVVERLLKPGGRFVALAFPLGERAGGPPFGVDASALVDMMRQRRFRLEHREIPADSVRPRLGREELLIMQKLGAAE